MSLNWEERNNGLWEDFGKNSFRQMYKEREINGKVQSAFYRYTKIDDSSYQLKCNIKILDRGSPQKGVNWGEAKIIFTEANKDEEFRLDFMHAVELKTCRLIYLGTQKYFPLDVTREGGLDIELTLRTIKSEKYDTKDKGVGILISLKVQDNLIFKDLLIPAVSFNGWVGFGTYYAKVEFRNVSITKIPNKKCFVVMPYNQRRNYLYRHAIKKSLDENGMYKFDKPYRLDESLRYGNIPKELQEKLIEADLIIADISEENLNVFYEIGFSYSRDKAILLLREKTSNFELPFDIRSDRYFGYRLPVKQTELDREMAKLKTKIIEFIKSNL